MCTSGLVCLPSDVRLFAHNSRAKRTAVRLLLDGLGCCLMGCMIGWAPLALVMAYVHHTSGACPLRRDVHLFACNSCARRPRRNAARLLPNRMGLLLSALEPSGGKLL